MRIEDISLATRVASSMSEKSTVVEYPMSPLDEGVSVNAVASRQVAVVRSTSSARAEDPYWGPAYHRTADAFGHAEEWYRETSVVDLVSFFVEKYPPLLELFHVTSPKGFNTLILRKYTSRDSYESCAYIVKLLVRDIVYAIMVKPNPEKVTESVTRAMNVLYG